MTLYHNLAAYDVRVSFPDGAGAFIVVFTYNLDATKKFVGIEFLRLLGPTDDARIAVPQGGIYGFREELRLLSRAVATYRGPRAEEKKIIEAKVTEAYGGGATVNITPHPIN